MLHNSKKNPNPKPYPADFSGPFHASSPHSRYHMLSMLNCYWFRVLIGQSASSVKCKYLYYENLKLTI